MMHDLNQSTNQSNSSSSLPTIKSSTGQKQEQNTTKIQHNTNDPVRDTQGAGPDQETVVTPSAVGINSARLQSAKNRLLFKPIFSLLLQATPQKRGLDTERAELQGATDETVHSSSEVLQRKLEN